MEAKNLRIGNLLHYQEQIVQVMATSNHVNKWDLELGYFKDSIGFQRKIDDVKRIPLTEEWLIRLGFDLVVKEGNQGEFRVYQLNEITYNTNHGWWWRHQLTVQPKYVHELQNLFFALTGRELELKSEKSAEL